MECEEFGNGQCVSEWSRKTGPGVCYKRKLGGGVAGVRLDVSAAVCGAAAALPQRRPRARRPAPPPPPLTHITHQPCVSAHDPTPPFMNGMDEISYWVTTKRAPCLMNYDSIVSKQSATNEIVESTCKVEEVNSPKKKKRRKLSILGDKSLSSGKQQNVYFDSSQQNQRTILSSCKSYSLDSDVDLNIRNTSIQDKTRKLKTKKYNRATLHKKNKVVTSTPKINSIVRKNQRKLDQAGNKKKAVDSEAPTIRPNKINFKSGEQVVISNVTEVNGDHKQIAADGKGKQKPVLNGQFEDLSDVSGLTANYIRSTKIKSSKTPRNIRKKCTRLFTNEPAQKCVVDDNGKALVCTNKANNTPADTGLGVLNYSTDSSQNVVNFLTNEDNKKSQHSNKSTSLLKFLDPKLPKSKECSAIKKDTTSKVDLNISLTLTSVSSGHSRYPKRHRNVVSNTSTNCLQLKPYMPVDTKQTDSFSLMKKSKNHHDLLETSRTRSGKCIRQKCTQPEDLVQVFSATTLPDSTDVSMNVAVARGSKPAREQLNGQKLQQQKSVGSEKKCLDNSRQLVKRNSLRNKSGFAACFSDSDNDSEPLKQRKFFDD